MSGTNAQITTATLTNGAGQGFWAAIGGGRVTPTEAFQQNTIESGTTATFMSAHITTGGFGGSANFNFRRNGLNGSQVCTASASALVTDATHMDNLSANDVIDYNLTFSGLYSVDVVSVTFNSALPYYLQGSGTTGGGQQAFSITPQFTTSMGGGQGGSGQPASVLGISSQVVGEPGVASSFAMNLSGAPTGIATINFNKNGSLANGIVSASGVTGTIVDSTHTDSLAQSDLIDVRFSSTDGTGFFYLTCFSMAGTTSAQQQTCSTTDHQTNSVDVWQPIGGALNSNLRNQTLEETYISYSMVASRLIGVSGASNGSSQLQISYQVNGSNGNQFVVLTGPAGEFIDLTHTDSVTAASVVNSYGHLNSGISGTLSSVGIGYNDGSFRPANGQFFHSFPP